MSNKYCTECGVQNVSTAKFCYSCGCHIQHVEGSQNVVVNKPKPKEKSKPQVIIVDDSEPMDDGEDVSNVDVNEIIQAADNSLAKEIFKHVQKMGLEKNRPVAIENVVGTQAPRKGRRNPKQKLSAKELLDSTKNRRSEEE